MGREFRMKANHNWAGLAAWNLKSKAECHTYEEYEKFLGPRNNRGIASNVEVVRYSFPVTNSVAVVLGAIGIKLYQTVILMYFSDHTFSADNGGYDTPTTIYRLHRFGPVGVSFYHKNRKLYCMGRGLCSLETSFAVPYPSGDEKDPVKYLASAGVGADAPGLSGEEEDPLSSGGDENAPSLSGVENRRLLFLSGLRRKRRAVLRR